MATLTTPPPAPAESGQTSTKEEQPYIEQGRKRHTGYMLLGIIVVWLVLYAVFKGHDTRALSIYDTNGFHTWINHRRDWLQLHGPGNWFFGGVLGHIGSFFNSVFGWLQRLISTPAFPRVAPQIGWLGVVAIFAWVAWAIAGIRSMILVTATLLMFGIWGAWQDSVDLLLVTFIAVVACFVIGLPVGVAMARRNAVSAAITPVLDLMQTMPPFAYLAPMALLFGIGPTTGILLTIVYAFPPMVRIAEHGIRSVPETTIEAASSMGLTKQQMLRQVQLPMAKRTIVVGINQSMMAALSMATIAALVNGPGLGGPVQEALSNLNVGAASVAGLLIVFTAIMLDRTTTAASERTESTSRGVASVSGPGVMLSAVVIEHLPRWAAEEGGKGARRRRLTPAGRWLMRGVMVVPVLVLVYVSRTYITYANFPTSGTAGFGWLKGINGDKVAKLVNDFNNWLVNHIDTVTLAIKNDVTNWFLNPLQNVLGDSPWWTTALVLLAFAFVLGGWRPLAIAAVCEAVIFGTGLWNDAMITLAMSLTATVLVMVLATVVGVSMGRNRRTDTILRPFLDAFQTIPPFVYLVPALALFGSSRFTAIIAAVAYAAPIASKLVADGIRGVSPTTVEAARSLGISRWQMITRVQLPMARNAMVLATNQAILYVLSMVVIGGMVGGGSLGYITVLGLNQASLFGKGLAAGIAITAMGIMLDRIARYAAARAGR
jgi:glycine betaine/proline transport system permease protein